MVKRNNRPERPAPGEYQPSQAVERVIAAIAWIGLVLLAAGIGLIYFVLGSLLWFLNKKIRMRYRYCL